MPTPAEELMKSLLEKGMTEDDAKDVVCKAFPFQKDEDKKDDMAKAVEDNKDDISKGCDSDKDDDKDGAKGDAKGKPADFEKLAKSLEDLRATLQAPNGLSAEEVDEKLSKALADQVDPIKQHAASVAQVADLLIAGQQKGMELLRKGLETLTETVATLAGAVQNPPEALAKSLAAEQKAADLEAAMADLRKENEDLRKSLANVVPQAKGVQTADEIVLHPGDKPAESNEWTRAKLLGRVEDLKKSLSGEHVHDADKRRTLANDILYALSGGQSPAAVAARFNLEV